MHINKVYGYTSKGDHSILDNVKVDHMACNSVGRVSNVRREALGSRPGRATILHSVCRLVASVSSRLGKVCVSLVMRPISVVPSSLGTSQIKQIGGGIQYSEF